MRLPVDMVQSFDKMSSFMGGRLVMIACRGFHATSLFFNTLLL